MSKRTVVRFYLCAALLVLLGTASVLLLAQQGEDNDHKPQFTTYPIFETFRATELVNGRVIYVPPVARHAIRNAPGDAAPGGVPGPPGGGGGGGGGSSDFGQPGAVAAPLLCFPNSANNFDATCASDSYQGEPALASDPTRGKLLGGHNDIYPGSCSASATPGGFGDCGLSAAVSGDGVSWQRFKLSRNWGGHDFIIGFDPTVAVDSQGTYYAAYGVADSGVSSANGVVAVKSTDGGASWIKTKAVALNLSGGKFEDKYWIAADANTASPFKDRVYVAWTRNQGNNQILMTSFSSDGGQTWSAPLKINDGTSKFERVLFSYVAVAPNGDVYVTWHDYARNQIFIDRSTNGGQSFGTDRVVANVSIDFPDLGCNGGRTMSPAPAMAIDPTGIYVVFGNDTAGAGLNLDVFLTKSTNNGVNWTAPVSVSATSAGHQYLPAVGIDSSGRINVSYLDRRDDAANCRTHTYLSRSTNGGASFTDFKMTDVDSHFDGNPNGPGDYQGLSCLGSSAHPYFSDHRDANVPLQTGNAGAFEVYTAIKP